MLEPLAGILLVTAVFLLLLLGLLPEGLRWLAQRNLQQRQQLVQAVRALEQELETLAHQLDPFHSLQAPQYRRIDDQATQLLAEVQAGRQALATAESLSFPRLMAVPWAVQHFISYPHDAVRIWQTWWRLRQMQQLVAAGRQTLAAAHAELGRLHQMPQQFRQESAQSLQRLQQIHDRLQQERSAGIEGLHNLWQVYGRLRQQATQLNQQLNASTNISLEEADQLGQALHGLAAELAQLEAEVAAAQQARQTLDQALNHSRQTQARLAAQDAPAQPSVLRQLLHLSHTLQEETAVLRRQAQFAQATELLAGCQALLPLAATLLSTRQQVRALLPLMPDSVDPGPIAALHQQLQHLEDELAERLQQLARQPYTSATSANRVDLASSFFAPQVARQPHTPLAPVLTGWPEAMQARLAPLQAQAVALQQAEQEAAQQLARELQQATQELQRTWQALQQLLPLAPASTLARNYAQVQAQRQAAQGKPRLLQQALSATRELTGDVQSSYEYLRLRFDSLSALVQDYPQFVSQVEAIAGQWRCLHPQVMQVKQCAMRIQQAWQKVRKTGWLDETHKLLDEVKQANQEAQQLSDTLQTQAEKLAGGVAQVERALGYLERAGMEMLESGRVARLEQMVNMLYDEARQATTYEQALTALQRADSLVWNNIQPRKE